MRIALFAIATGKYKQFVPGFIESVRKNFLIGEEVFALIISDSDVEHCVMTIDHEQWPGPALHRYHHINEALRRLKEIDRRHWDYIFYCDIDSKFVSPVQSTDILTGELLGTVHPRFHDKPEAAWFEENQESLAYIAPEKRGPYLASGFLGGPAGMFKHAADKMDDMQKADEKKGIIPKWHDEAYWNWYFVSYVLKKRYLTPGYAYPEQGTCDGINMDGIEPKIHALIKPIDCIDLSRLDKK